MKQIPVAWYKGLTVIKHSKKHYLELEVLHRKKYINKFKCGRVESQREKNSYY